MPTTPSTRLNAVIATSFAARTRALRGSTRNVERMVPCRNSVVS